jgi:hypothetical protein
MISFKEHLAEAFGDSAKYYKAIQTVEAALDQAIRPYERLHDAEWIRHMGPKFVGRGAPATIPERQFLRSVTSLWLKGGLAMHGVVWLLNFDQSTRPKTGPLSADKLKTDVAVIAEPVNGTVIVVPSIRSPRVFMQHKSSGSAIGFSGISTAVRQATATLKWYADNHHKAHYFD